MVQVPQQQRSGDQAYPSGDFQRSSEGYGYYQQNNPGGYQGGYAPPPHPHATQNSYQGYVPPQQQSYGYTPPYSVNPGYSPNINVTVINNASPGGKNDGALAVEIILSLLGIFGVGWLIAGETTAGILLLIGSIFLYWPIMFFGTLITDGFGLICLGPIMIASIIINAVLLNNALKRKAVPFVVVQQPPMQMPPRQ
ncbi:MAG: hypothetical protein JO011_08800 [Ktedonobacteraceae bacterium]|nr:hypothetical protein [Ktedonobacteraceae bacterium]